MSSSSSSSSSPQRSRSSGNSRRDSNKDERPREPNKELDIIEMAVYGDVLRPGNQCRCKTVAEMLGTYKSKDHMAACKLPSANEPL
ncbi:hypothetical protein RJ639_041799 [Escallonia herrerae]|uniref:Uncharacterized protein n=1 Tax=Escallonia herrerae TaxID=1293975 RepID=A0AA88WF22_9ASTE|nr:hypothetical protein RJ639_041799 [Escallonia herrerae]